MILNYHKIISSNGQPVLEIFNIQKLSDVIEWEPFLAISREKVLLEIVLFQMLYCHENRLWIHKLCLVHLGAKIYHFTGFSNLEIFKWLWWYCLYDPQVVEYMLKQTQQWQKKMINQDINELSYYIWIVLTLLINKSKNVPKIYLNPVMIHICSCLFDSVMYCAQYVN